MATAVQARHTVSTTPARKAAEGEPAPGLRAHFWFTVIFLIYVLDSADRFLIGAVVQSVKEEFALSDAQVGLMSGMFYIGLGLLAVPAGILVDRFSRKYMIVVMTSIWSIATWTSGLARSYPGLLASRLAVGAGEAGYNPAGYALIGAWYPRRLRGLMVGIFNIAGPLGAGIGIGVAGHLTLEYGWRSAFGVMSVPGLVLAGLMLFAPDYRTIRVEAGAAREAKAGLLETLRFIAANRTLRLLYLIQLPVSFYVFSMAGWVTTFYMRAYDLNVAQASRMVGILTLVAMLGPPLGGWLSDRATRANPLGRITVAIVFLAVPLVLMSLSFLSPILGLPVTVALVAGSLGHLFVAGHWGTLVAAGLDLVPPHYRGTCQGFLPAFQALTAIWSGSVTGLMSDRFGLPIALEITLLAGLITALFLLVAARATYLADYARQESLGCFRIDTGT
jgi:MFS family permease